MSTIYMNVDSGSESIINRVSRSKHDNLFLLGSALEQPWISNA